MQGKPVIGVRRFPMDAALAFFRLEVSFEAQIARLARLVELVEVAVSDYTSETKVTLTTDGTMFIIAFLTDKKPLEQAEMQRIAENVIGDFLSRDAGEDKGQDT